MKRVILSLMAMVVAVSMAAQEPEEDDAQLYVEVLVQPKKGPGTNHTISTTLGLGLEYGFEWEYVERATLVARIGLASKDFTLRSALDNFQWSSTM